MQLSMQEYHAKLFWIRFFSELNFTVLTVFTLPFLRETGASAGASVGLPMDL